MATIQELMEFKREEEWQRAGVPESDIRFSRLSGVDARDVRTFREGSHGGLIFVVRCPKVTARPWHGLMPPKPKSVQQKTGESGVVVTPTGQMFVSDYDLMSVWKFEKDAYRKVFVASTSADPSRGPYSEEAKRILRDLNWKLVSRIQHGCQDDYLSAKNRGVKPDDEFAAFTRGVAEFLASPAACRAFYEKNKLSWPYDLAGKYNGPTA